MAIVEGVPHFDEDFPTTNDGDRISFLARIIRIPDPVSALKLAILPGGWTNKVYEFVTPQQRYTVREYGSNTGRIINRAKELNNIKTIGLLTIYVTFRNGAVLNYQEGVPLTVRTLREQRISDALANVVAKFHRVTLGQPGETEIWDKIRLFAEGLDPANPTCDFPWLMAKVAAKRQFIEERFRDRPVCLCHNDLTPGNLLWDEATGRIGLIDYEYSGWNWPEYDIANHFFERVGLDFDIGLFPTVDEQKQFIRTYLAALNDEEPSEDLVDDWRQRVALLVPLSGIHWGVWGHYENQTSHGWPYQLYAEYRMILADHNLPLPHGHVLLKEKLLPET
jgi:ethanolamine kinase